MGDFHFAIPRWRALMNGLVVLAAAGAAYKIGTREAMHWLDLLFTGGPLLAALLNVWNDVRQVGGRLKVSERGIEYSNDHHPSLNWRIGMEELEAVGTFNFLFEQELFVLRRSGSPKRLLLAQWRPGSAVRPGGKEHALLASLRAITPVRELTRDEAGKERGKLLELGKVAERYTYVSVGLVLVAFAIMLVHPLRMLGDGVPWSWILTAVEQRSGCPSPMAAGGRNR